METHYVNILFSDLHLTQNLNRMTVSVVYNNTISVIYIQKPILTFTVKLLI